MSLEPGANAGGPGHRRECTSGAHGIDVRELPASTGSPGLLRVSEIHHELRAFALDGLSRRLKIIGVPLESF